MSVPSADRWQELSEHLDRILELSAADAAAYLSTLQSVDQDLSDQLERLLASRRQEAYADFLAGAAPLSDPLPGDAPLVGRPVGAYVIDALIGQGGMGNVWRAHRADGRFDTTVAIKFVNVSWLGGAAEQRFRAEGRLLGRLDHANIARLIDAGVLDGTQPHLVLEYVDGEPIDVYCRRLNLDLQASIRLFLDVLAAVAHAHSHLIVHRDLKPSNIMVTRDGVVKLLDFGIATLLDADTGVAPQTLAGSRALTPLYSAPEQMLGQPVTTATDIYSLGLVCYLILAGRHPLAAEDSADVARLQLLMTAEPPQLSKAACTARIAPRALQGDLDNIAAKALKKSPAERYRSVDAFADDLRRYLSHEPVRARADSFVYRSGKFMRRHGVGVAIAALVALTLLGATIGMSLQKREADRQREEAVAQAVKAEAASRLLLRMVEEIGTGNGTLTPVQVADRGVYLLGQQLNAESPTKVDQLHLMAVLYDELGEKQKSYDVLVRSAAMAQRLDYQEGMIVAQCDLVEAELSLDHRDRAQSHLDQARRLLAAMKHPPVLPAARLHMMTAVMNATNGDFHAAISEGERSVQLLRDSGNVDNLSYVGAITRLSDYHDQLGNALEAHRYTLLASQWMDSYGAGGTIGKLNVLNNQAADFMNFGEVRAANAATAEVMRRLAERGDPPATRVSFSANHGAVLAALGRFPEALAVLERTIADAAASNNSFWQERAQFFRARTLIRAGRDEEGKAQLDAIEAVYRRDPVRNEGFLWSVAVSRAELLLHTGQAAAAQQVLQTLFKQIDYPAQTTSWVLRVALPVAAETALALQDPAGAKAYASAAVTLARQAARDVNQSADVGRSMVLLARAEHAQSEDAAAVQTVRSALPALSGGLGPGHAEVMQARNLAAAWQPH